MPSGEPVYPPPPQRLLYPMRRLMTYKGEVVVAPYSRKPA